jgi:hypothetical protein
MTMTDDERELALFGSFLRGVAAAKRGDAIDAQELLYAVIYGDAALVEAAGMTQQTTTKDSDR